MQMPKTEGFLVNSSFDKLCLFKSWKCSTPCVQRAKCSNSCAVQLTWFLVNR